MGVARGVSAAIVMFLPFLAWVGWRLFGDSRLKRLPHCAPILERLEKLRIVLHRTESGRDLFQIAALYWKKEADRLFGVEMHPGVWSREAPVHREGKGRPIRFHDARQSLDAVFEIVRGAADPKIPTWRCTKEARDVKSKNALSKNRYWHQFRCYLARKLNQDTIGPWATRPARIERARGQYLPAVRIRDVEREAAVRERLGCIGHPIAGRFRWAD